MVHPLFQTLVTDEGSILDVVVEFCAEPAYNKVFWMSDERVYLPGGQHLDGVRALPIEVKLFILIFDRIIITIY